MHRQSGIPSFFGEWLRRLRFLLRRRAMEEELRLEMESHRALMDDPRAFGNTLRLHEEARDAWGWTWLDDLVRDTRLAGRTLFRTPGFAITATLTLALGIGVNIAMFTVVNSMLLRPLHERADRVTAVHGRGTTPSAESGASGTSGAPADPGALRGVSYPNYLDLRAGTNDVFAPVAAYGTNFVGLDAGSGARRALAVSVTANYFDIFDRPLLLGRPFTSDEERPGADLRVAIVSFSLWQQRGADSRIIGQTVRVNGETFTVIGVTAKGFTGTSIPGPDVWLPLGTYAIVDKSAGPGAFDARDKHAFGVIAKLRDGVSMETASSALTIVASRLEQAFPSVNAGYTLAMSAPMRLLFMPGPDSGTMMTLLALLLMAMPMIVLLVACLNLADLLIARGHARRQELAIRASLGGGRWRLVRQLLTEALFLATAGAAVGLVLSAWATDALAASLRVVLPVSLVLPEFDLDWRVLAGTIGFSLLASLIFGAWPALDLTRRATATDLKQRIGGAGAEGRQPGSIGVGNVLVVAQTALSLLLLACGGLFAMSAIGAATADPGFRLERGLLAEIDPGLAGYDDARASQFHLEVVDRLRAVPGVEAVTIGSSFPFTEFGDSRRIGRVDRPDAAPASKSDSDSEPKLSTPIDAGFMAVGRDYARTLGLRVLGGRDFTDAEMSSASAASERVAMIDDELARRLWPGGVAQSAVGQLIQPMNDSGAADGPPVRVIGLVSAVNESLGNPHPSPHVYVPLGQHRTSAMTLQLRAAAGQDERAMLTSMARVIRDVDERVPVLRLATWRDRLDASVEVWTYRAGARVCGAFGAMALLLAVIGIYGVKSYVVSRRTREFGIRLAVGAHPRALLWQVMREGVRLTSIGIIIGVMLALGAGRFLQHVLYRVNGAEPLVLIAAPAILLAASLLAAFLPALRATRVDPTVALRTE